MTHYYSHETLQKIYELDAEFIGLAFLIGEEIGIISIGMTIKNFQNLLFQKQGDYISYLDIEYKSYMLGLFKNVIAKIEDRHHQFLVTEYISKLDVFTSKR